MKFAGAAAPGASFGVKGVGLVMRFSQAIGYYGLSAEVRNGRVTTLLIDDPQGGE